MPQFEHSLPSVGLPWQSLTC